MIKRTDKAAPKEAETSQEFVSAALTSTFVENRNPDTPRPEELSVEVRPGGSLRATITTERLSLTPVTVDDFKDYHRHLLGNEKVIEKFADGEPRDVERVLKAVTMWADRWRDGNPMSALAIRTKEGEFVGHVIAGGGDSPGQSEVAYLIKSEYWGEGVGKEAVLAVINHFVPLMKTLGYQTEGVPLRELQATSRTDNPASEAILRRAGLVVEKIGEKFGHERFHFIGDIKMPDPSATFEITTSAAGTAVKEQYEGSKS